MRPVFSHISFSDPHSQCRSWFVVCRLRCSISVLSHQQDQHGTTGSYCVINTLRFQSPSPSTNRVLQLSDFTPSWKSKGHNPRLQPGELWVACSDTTDNIWHNCLIPLLHFRSAQFRFSLHYPTPGSPHSCHLCDITPGLRASLSSFLYHMRGVSEDWELLSHHS